MTEPLDLSGVTVVRIDDTGAAGRPLRGPAGRGRRPAAGRPAPRSVARRRRGDDLDQLHVGHHRAAEGRDVHPPRRLPQRPRRGHHHLDDLRHRVPVDAADVPLQRLVLHLGGHRRGRHATSASAGSTPPASGSCSTAKASPTSTARPPSTSAWSTTRPPTASSEPVTDHRGRRAAVADAARPARASSNFRTVHVYGLTETYGPYTVCDWHDDWDSTPRRRAGPAPLPPGPGLRHRRPGPGGRPTT